MNVPVGPASIVGYILTALGAIGAGIAAAEHEMAGPGKWLAILAVVAGVMTNLGRQLQAPRGVAAGQIPVLLNAPPDGQSQAKLTEGP